MKNITAALIAMCLLGGCTSSVSLRQSATGKTAQCGPYWMGGMAQAFTAAERERGCIADFQRQGYERVN